MSTRTSQHSIPSGFRSTTAVDEIIEGCDLNGKTAIVTGGYSGLGLETTRALARAGATVIVPGRSFTKAMRALAGIPRVEQRSLDLLYAPSIASFAQAFLANGSPLHLLINCAGIMAVPFGRDDRGNELHLSVNHLGHFDLTIRLWPALRQANGARIVTLTSRAHHFSNFQFSDPNYERRPYEKWQAYGQSKTATALFALEADARGAPDGIQAFCVHPGTVVTDLARFLSESELSGFGVPPLAPHGFIPPDQTPEKGVTFRTLAQGAATIVWCATSAQLADNGGVYCEDSDVAKVVVTDDPFQPGVRSWAVDPESAQRLWQLSESLTGARVRS